MVKELFEEDKIPQQSIDEEIKSEELAYKTLVSPNIRGGEATIGTGDRKSVV